MEALWIDMQIILFTPKPTLDVTLSQLSKYLCKEKLSCHFLSPADYNWIFCLVWGPHLPSPSMPRSPGYGTYQGRRRKEAPPLVMMFPCIPCGQDVELGEKGLTDCLRNLTLERIVERYNPRNTHIMFWSQTYTNGMLGCENQRVWEHFQFRLISNN